MRSLGWSLHHGISGFIRREREREKEREREREREREAGILVLSCHAISSIWNGNVYPMLIPPLYFGNK
jgi:hypothetical protein